MVRVQAIRKEALAEGVTAYWVSIEGCNHELRVEIDETTEMRLFRLEDLMDTIGRPAAPLIARLVARYHDGEDVSLPQDVEV